MAYREPTVKVIRRLARLDALLAGEGITVTEAAEQFGLSKKTIRRDIETLRCLGMDLPKGKVTADGKPDGNAVHYRYADGRRVFQDCVSEVTP